MRAIVFEELYSVTIRVEGDLTADTTTELSGRVAQWREMTREKKMRLDLGAVGRSMRKAPRGCATPGIAASASPR
jgi:hypothetical protein